MYENDVLIDARNKKTIKIRLNSQNTKYEISIPDDTKKIIVTASRNTPEVRAGFKSTSGSMSTYKLGGSTTHEFEYSDRTNGFFCLELDGECKEGVDFEVNL